MTDVKDRGLTGAILDALWPILGGSHTAASVWTEIDNGVSDVIARHQPQEREAVLVEAVRRVRDGYASQAKFADHEPASYFREFVQRLDAALTTPAPAIATDANDDRPDPVEWR